MFEYAFTYPVDFWCGAEPVDTYIRRVNAMDPGDPESPVGDSMFVGFLDCADYALSKYAEDPRKGEIPVMVMCFPVDFLHHIGSLVPCVVYKNDNNGHTQLVAPVPVVLPGGDFIQEETEVKDWPKTLA